MAIWRRVPGSGTAVLAAVGAWAAVAAAPGWAEVIRPRPRPAEMVQAAAGSVELAEAASLAVEAEATVTPVALALSRPEPRPEGALQEDAAPALSPLPELPPRKAEPVRDPNRGAVTNLPLPRFVSLKTGEGNARRGPGLTHRIDWVFTRAGMPLKITAEFENWRRVEDIDGLGGWVHYSLLSGVRSVIVKGDLSAEAVDFHTMARTDTAIAFRAEAGVVAKVLNCEEGWCRVQVEGNRGWAPVAALWGVEPGETID